MIKKLIAILLLSSGVAYAASNLNPNTAANIRDIADLKGLLASSGTVKSITAVAPLTGGTITNVGSIGLGSLPFSNMSAGIRGKFPYGSGSSTGTNTGDETTATIKTKLGITTLSGSNTGDVTIATANGLSLSGQALSLQAATNSVPGALTASDHTIFAACQPAATAITTGNIASQTVTTATGNAGTATALATPRAINGVNFDGTAAITVADATKAVIAQTMYIGTTSHAINRASAPEALTGITSIDGSAAKLTTGRTTGITGPITWTSPTFDGSGNVTAAATVTSQTGTGSTFAMQQGPLLNLPYAAGADSGTQQFQIGHSNQVNYWGMGRDNAVTGDFILTSGATEYFRVTAAGVTKINKGSNIVYRCTGATNLGMLTVNSALCVTGYVTTSLSIN